MPGAVRRGVQVREIRDRARVTAIRGKSSYQRPRLAAHMDTGQTMPGLIKLGEVTW
jgi:hypothetical protein